MKDYRIRASKEEMARSLEGNWQEDVLFELQQAIEAYDFCRQQVAHCDRKLQQYLAALPNRTMASAQPAESQDGQTSQKKQKRKGPKANGQPRKIEPQFDPEAELTRICGVNLATLPGVDVLTVQTWMAELGVDMTPWPTEDRLVSCLKLSPNPRITGGKVIRPEKIKVKNRVAEVLRLAATTLINSDGYLGARYRYLRSCQEPPKAIKAMAAYLAKLFYRMLTKGKPWVDRGNQEHQRRRAERERHALERKAAARRLRLVPAA